MSYAPTNSSPSSPLGAAPARRSAQLMVLAFVANAIVGAPARLVTALAARHREARQIAALEALSDHVLADIGIARQDIRHMVRQSGK
jgi:uncharacterized protein YjiS (DUF1127 family)